jgi:hypothetical protein
LQNVETIGTAYSKAEAAATATARCNERNHANLIRRLNGEILLLQTGHNPALPGPRHPWLSTTSRPRCTFLLHHNHLTHRLLDGSLVPL